MSRLLACDLESRARSVVRTELESQMEAQSTTYLTARGSRVLYFRVLFLILYSPVRTPPHAGPGRAPHVRRSTLCTRTFAWYVLPYEATSATSSTPSSNRGENSGAQ